jgi:D-glycero-alpha-D-manno-heptose 1-phosphate guanylyltransferase
MILIDSPTMISELNGSKDKLKKEIQAVLLVGGLGTRLRSVVPSAPKPLASVGDRSFLELLVLQLRSQGIRRLVMCTGYLGDQIETEFKDGQALDVKISYSREQRPLGTAGALQLATAHLSDASEFIVMNGDSFLEMDFAGFLHFHRSHGGIASLAARRVEDAARYGTLELDGDGRVKGFMEKTEREAPGMINGGVYIFDKAMLDHIQPGASSLEREVFPQVLRYGVYAQEQNGLFIDIGTPEDYARAQTMYEKLMAKASISKN